MSVRLRLDLSYDGTSFSGWALQPGRRTVAGMVGDALAVLFRAPVPMVVAGRTDAGVHATGQVAHIDVDESALTALTPRHRMTGTGGQLSGNIDGGVVGLRRRLAGLLPTDVRAFRIAIAPPGFDARFSALRRHYRYGIVSSDWGAPPLERIDVLVWRRPLDISRMNCAATELVGLHDFAAFCKPRAGATTVRDLQRLTVTATPLGAGDANLVEIHVSADAFCHSMVRSLVSALVAVGEGRFDIDRPARLLADRRRTAKIGAAPAHGLTLVGVDYPPESELAERAAQTRAVRHDPCR